MFTTMLKTRSKSEIADIVAGIVIAIMLLLTINPGHIFFLR
ncbi:MAG TPA: hypothetical protein VGQ07_08185 [Nitrospirales bacterium]|jgi:hypothetical protein|nr:hypothetical protein [Nitrospirales bacterium]